MESTPWGQAQHEEILADGIISCSTASHGGIWLDAKRRAKLKFYSKNNYLKSSTWWEEDCDWAIPYVFFANDIREYGSAYKFKENLAAAHAIIKHHHPDFIV